MNGAAPSSQKNKGRAAGLLPWHLWQKLGWDVVGGYLGVLHVCALHPAHRQSPLEIIGNIVYWISSRKALGGLLAQGGCFNTCPRFEASDPFCISEATRQLPPKRHASCHSKDTHRSPWTAGDLLPYASKPSPGKPSVFKRCSEPHPQLARLKSCQAQPQGRQPREHFLAGLSYLEPRACFECQAQTCTALWLRL